MSSLFAAVKGELRRHGSKHTLRLASLPAGSNAWTTGLSLGGGAVPAYSECMAYERKYKPAEIRGGINEHDCLVTIDAASCLSVPVEGARIAPGVFTEDAGAEWRHIVNVTAVKVGGRVAVYKLQVRR